MSPPHTLLHLAELANAGRPLFPGNDVDDQLKRIFRYPSMFPFTLSSLKGRKEGHLAGAVGRACDS